MTVYIDKKKLHDTPLQIDLAVGKHVVRLVNAEQGKDETRADHDLREAGADRPDEVRLAP